MKKFLPYIASALIIIPIGIFLSRHTDNRPHRKTIDTRITLSEKDKNPYGAYIWYESMKNFFPTATFQTTTRLVGIDTLSEGDANDKLLLIVIPFLNAQPYEINSLMDFVKKGNCVFINTFDIGYDFEKILRVRVSNLHVGQFPYGNEGPFGMKQKLANSPFQPITQYRYPGQVMEAYFTTVDTAVTTVLGMGHKNSINFIRLRHGSGNLFVHLSPMCFTNYFLLYADNHRYFEQVFSLIPTSISAVIWDKYFSTVASGHHRVSQKTNWLSSIMQHPSFRAAILTALLFLLIYAITEMRRRQRVIPVLKPLVNDSLEFVKTMGLLYYESKDHHNLAQKMSTYFLEHVRSHYRIFAKQLDDPFINELSHKSGASQSLVAGIVEQIKQINCLQSISDTELLLLQKDMEKFYDSTQ